MQEIREQGYEPDAIILGKHEAEKLLRINFSTVGPEEIASIKLFGLPVKIQ